MSAVELDKAPEGLLTASTRPNKRLGRTFALQSAAPSAQSEWTEPLSIACRLYRQANVIDENFQIAWIIPLDGTKQAVGLLTEFKQLLRHDQG